MLSHICITCRILFHHGPSETACPDSSPPLYSAPANQKPVTANGAESREEQEKRETEEAEEEDEDEESEEKKEYKGLMDAEAEEGEEDEEEGEGEGEEEEEDIASSEAVHEELAVIRPHAEEEEEEGEEAVSEKQEDEGKEKKPAQVFPLFRKMMQRKKDAPEQPARAPSMASQSEAQESQSQVG